MKKILTTLFVFFGLFGLLNAQDSDRLIGQYYTEGGRGKVVIEKVGDKFKGTLVWTINEGAKDIKNPVASERESSGWKSHTERLCVQRQKCVGKRQHIRPRVGKDLQLQDYSDAGRLP